MILLEVAVNLFTRIWFRIRTVTSARQACRKIAVLSLNRSQCQLACEGLYSSGHSHSLYTSTSDYTSAQWRLVLHILVTCSPHVNKCWVMRAIYGIRCGWSHWPITIQHVWAQWVSVVLWRACSTGSEKTARVSRSFGNFLNRLKKYLQIWITDLNAWLVGV